jgi:hypothetical protein
MLNETTDCAVTAASFTERALTDLPSDVAQSTPSDVAQSIDRKTPAHTEYGQTKKFATNQRAEFAAQARNLWSFQRQNRETAATLPPPSTSRLPVRVSTQP